MTEGQREALDRDGFVKLEGFLSAGLLDRLRTRVEELFESEGDQAGSEFRLEPGSRRLANCIDKGAVFLECIERPEVLEMVGHVLGPRFKLSSCNVRSANPRNGVSQPLHADMGAVADERGYWVCNTVWLLDDFTLENGALRAIPGTHRLGRLPQSEIEDLAAAHPAEVLITGRAGDVVVMNAHLWHGGTENRTDRQRRALHGFYCRWDKPQQQHQKQLLRRETQASLTPEQRILLAIDDPLNDRLSSADMQKSGFLK